MKGRLLANVLNKEWGGVEVWGVGEGIRANLAHFAQI